MQGKQKTDSDKLRRLITLCGVCVAGVILTLDVTVVGVALESIGTDLRASFANLQWIANAYNIAFGSFLLAGGSLADLFGRKRIFAFGIVVFTIASLSCGLAQSALTLDLLRGLQGFGAAFVLSSGFAILANEFQEKDRARAFGFLGASFGIGLALGPLIGGLLISGPGWRWAFFVNVPIGIALLLFAVPRINETRDPEATIIDWLGLATFTSSLFFLIYAFIAAPEAGWGSWVTVGSFAAAAMFLLFFLLAEYLQQRPMFDLSLFRNKTFVGVLLMPFAFGFGFVSLLLYIPLYFQSVGSYTALRAGLVMLPLTLPLFFVPPVAGKLFDAVGARVLLGTAGALIGIGTLLMHGLNVSTTGGTILFVTGLVLTGIGAGILNGIMDNVAISEVAVERSGMAAGIFSTMRLATEAVAIAVAGAILIGLTKHNLSAMLSNAGAGIPASQINEAVNLVARGDINGAAAFVSPESRSTFVEMSKQSYTSALQSVFFVLSGISFIATALAYFLVRRNHSDLTNQN